MTSPFGTPFPPSQRPPSLISTLVVDPAIGFDVSHSALNIAGGATPNSDNYIMREGRLEPRPRLSMLTDSLGIANLNPSPVVPIVGGSEYIDVNGKRRVVALYPGGTAYALTTRADTWGFATPTGAVIGTSPSARFDVAQIFWDVANDNALVVAPDGREGLYAYVPGAPSYSQITNAPGAKAICAYDNYLLALNVQDGGDTFPQRLMWCDRGSLSSWTGGLSGFEDLLAARGEGTRLVPLENRVAVFFEDEIWTATPSDFPNVFRVLPLDQTGGCPYPRTITVTPKGVIFMARNFELKLLPKDGGQAVDIGQPIHRSVRDSIAFAPRAFGAYDGIRNHYGFYYATSADSGGLPHRAVWLNLDTGAWAPQSFASAPSGSATSNDIGLTCGFTANLSQSKTTSWDEELPAWDSETLSWNDFLGLGNERQTVILGSSGGTVFELRSEQSRDARSASTEGSPVVSFFESKLLGEEYATQQKTIMRTAIDYVAPSASSLSVRALVGGAFNVGVRTSLLTSSAVTQGYADDYAPSRYAAIRVESSDQTAYQLQRFHVTMRVGGR